MAITAYLNWKKYIKPFLRASVEALLNSVQSLNRSVGLAFSSAFTNFTGAEVKRQVEQEGVSKTVNLMLVVVVLDFATLGATFVRNAWHDAHY